MIQYLEDAAEAVGISAIITNSNEKIETQLNRLTREEDLPLILISWDINVSLNFDQHGFLDNPSLDIVALLVTKPETTAKTEAETTAFEMGVLFQKFLIQLRSSLVPVSKIGTEPVTGASYKLVPVHGAGKHSGILGKFTMIGIIYNC
jgi:hypothetical protein